MISVVIPVYNAQKYLKDCIESVIAEESVPMEIIVINDGSSDCSGQICREYALRDERITVIEKENTGVSDTRNRGISAAKGEYILFVDADDYLQAGAIRKISDALTEHGAPDLLVWGFSSVGERRVYNDTHLLRTHPADFTPPELLQHLFSIEPRQRFRGLVWRCIFKAALLRKHDIQFHRELKMAEDFKFLADAISKASRISVLPEELYVYRINNESATAGYKSNVHGDMAWVNREMERDLCEKYPELLEDMKCCCAETYIVAIQNCCNAGTPYSIAGRIRYAWKIRKEFGYSQKIRSACGRWRRLSRRQVLVYTMLRLYLEPLYIVLYSMKRKTLLKSK